MLRRLLPAGMLAMVAVVGCHSKSFPLPPTDAEVVDGASDASCTCTVTGSLGPYVIDCGSETCVDGTVQICSGAAQALNGGPCGTDAASSGEACAPSCSGQRCDESDHCGGICSCAAGLVCNPSGACGNGCQQRAGAGCVADGGALAACCAEGYVCQDREGGAGACCVEQGAQGSCSVDTDCCAYPTLRCDVASGTCN